MCGIIRDARGRVLLCQRSESQSNAGLWEFPGGKVERGEVAEEALERELLEELGSMVVVSDELTPVTHRSGDYELLLKPFLCCLAEGAELPRAIEHQCIEWVMLDDLRRYDLSPADVPILNELLTLSRI